MVVLAKVRRSQSVSAVPLYACVTPKKSGSVLCAHCSCKAGLGKAFSRLSALLFTLEAHMQVAQSNSDLDNGYYRLCSQIIIVRLSTEITPLLKTERTGARSSASVIAILMFPLNLLHASLLLTLVNIQHRQLQTEIMLSKAGTHQVGDARLVQQ